MSSIRSVLIKFFWCLVIVFIFMNIVAIFHGYRFTHFADADVIKTDKPENLSIGAKLKAIIFGVSNPKPVNSPKPSLYKTIYISSEKSIEGWYASNDSVRGTVILFHGYGGEKSGMLDKANVFESLNYNTLLIDFAGSGGSEGNTTTIGFKEADQVKAAFDYLVSQGEQHIYLFGSSMGAVAIMKAIHDYNIQPNAIILECPFGTMYETVVARFDNMNLPSFPMAGLLVFWGGVQNGFWAFNHNPTEYALNVHCPTLLMYGEKDQSVRKNEIEEIYNNLAGKKSLKTYPLAGHENYLNEYSQEWIDDVTHFLSGY